MIMLNHLKSLENSVLMKTLFQGNQFLHFKTQRKYDMKKFTDTIWLWLMKWIAQLMEMSTLCPSMCSSPFQNLSQRTPCSLTVLVPSHIGEMQLSLSVHLCGTAKYSKLGICWLMNKCTLNHLRGLKFKVMARHSSPFAASTPKLIWCMRMSAEHCRLGIAAIRAGS